MRVNLKADVKGRELFNLFGKIREDCRDLRRDMAFFVLSPSSFFFLLTPFFLMFFFPFVFFFLLFSYSFWTSSWCFSFVLSTIYCVVFKEVALYVFFFWGDGGIMQSNGFSKNALKLIIFLVCMVLWDIVDVGDGN